MILAMIPRRAEKGSTLAGPLFSLGADWSRMSVTAAQSENPTPARKRWPILSVGTTVFQRASQRQQSGSSKAPSHSVLLDESGVMSKANGFISPGGLTLSFPPTVSTDEQRVLYALWRERAQPIDRLCLHTGLGPVRVINAVRKLASSGRLKVNPDLGNWEDDAPPESEPAGSERTESQNNLLVAAEYVALKR
jgi:hypothetical protein